MSSWNGFTAEQVEKANRIVLTNGESGVPIGKARISADRTEAYIMVATPTAFFEVSFNAIDKVEAKKPCHVAE